MKYESMNGVNAGTDAGVHACDASDEPQYEMVRITALGEFSALGIDMSALDYQRTVTIKVREYYPDHLPREDDPYHAVFNKTRNTMKKEGRLLCHICGTDKQIELHHMFVEFSLKTGMDWQEFARLNPNSGIVDEESFFRWVETEPNMLALCKFHHVGAGGIHVLPFPQWVSQRYWKKGLTPAAIKAMSFGEVVFLMPPEDAS